MILTQEQQAILNGEKGEVLAKVMKTLVMYGDAFGAERMVLISDSGRCAGQPEGTRFMLGGQEAYLTDGVAYLVIGPIACSATNLWKCVTNVISWGIPEEDAIRAATYNPACSLGVQDQVGSIATGALADFIVCRSDYTGRRVFMGGKEL